MNSKLKTEKLDFRLVKPNKSNVVKTLLTDLLSYENVVE